MKKLRSSLILLLIGISIFFNIERLDFGEENIIDVSSIVYALGFAAVVSTVAFPVFQRLNLTVLLTLWSGIYLVSKFIFLKGRPFLGGIYTYLSITEMALLLALVWLVYKTSSALREFEEAVEKITFANSDNKHILQLDEAAEEIQTEMFRSRNYKRSLSLIVVQPNLASINSASHYIVQEVQNAMINNYLINNMAHTLNKYLRRTDVILEQREQGRFLILCPETQLGDIDLLVEYIQSITAEQLGITINCGAATFPDEAITFDDLLHQAGTKLDNSQS